MDKTYCVFGDSISQAAYVRNSWVNLLKADLEEKFQDDFVNVFNLGIDGNTTNDILARFENESTARIPTSIIFAIGVNDSAYIQSISRPIIAEKVFESNLKKLIALAVKFSKDITFVGLVLGDDSILKPLPGGTENYEWSYDRKRTENYNNILETITRSENCKFIQLLDQLGPEDFQDGLHPNDQGHRKMFEIIKKYF